MQALAEAVQQWCVAWCACLPPPVGQLTLVQNYRHILFGDRSCNSCSNM